MYNFGLIMLIALLSSLLLSPGQQAQAQSSTRRWLAEPMLLAQGKAAAAIDLAPVDATHVWAAHGFQILFFDGSAWSVQFTAPTPIAFIEMAGPQKGWAVSSHNSPTSQPTLYVFDASGWRPAASPQSITQNLIAAGDGTVLAVGWNGIYGSNARQTLEYFDGVIWRTITPFDRSSINIQRTADGATWIWGNSSSGISSFDAPRPYVLRYDNGTLTSLNVPSSGPSGPDVTNRDGLTSVQMMSRTEGWASLVTTHGEQKVYHYLNGVWSQTSVPTPPDRGSATYQRLNFVAGTSNELLAMIAWDNPYNSCSKHTVLRYAAGTWTIMSTQDYALRGAFIPTTNTGWFISPTCADQGLLAQRYWLENGVLTLDTAGSDVVPDAYHLISNTVQWAVASGMILHYTTSTMPTAPVAARPGARFFPETGHNLSGPFRTFYERNGLDYGEAGISPAESLGLFGLPLTEPFHELNPDTGEYLQVQYFERVRLEYHPRNPEPYKILLGRLGALRYIQVYGEVTPGTTSKPPATGCERFAATNHYVCSPFRSYWHSVGSVQIFGLPIAPAKTEKSYTDGQEYLTLWTERERLEHHPELAGTRYEILLGLLAKEDLRMRGYLE